MICRMNYADVEDVYEIEKICFSKPWPFESIKEEITNPSAYFIVYKENGKVLGYAGMYSVCSEGYMNNIAVLPDFRNMGIANKLLDDILSHSVQIKLDFLSLETRVSNLPAINLYNSKEFKIVGKRSNFYSKPKEDAFIMTKFFKND